MFVEKEAQTSARQSMRMPWSFGRCCEPHSLAPLVVPLAPVLSLSLLEVPDTRKLVRIAKLANAPVVLKDGEEEVMIALAPGVFERLLFERGSRVS